jgi:signal transduction histidine kinase
LIRSVGTGYVVAAVVFAVAGVLLTTEPVNGGGVAAAILSVAISGPVLFAGRAPAGAACAQAAGFLLNEVLFGPMIRCGYVLPTMLVIVFSLGSADSGSRRRGLWFGICGCLATSVMMLLWDPALDSSAGIFIAGLVAGFFLAGRLIRSRTVLVNTLRRRTDELAQQRDRTAALEVAADRARVGADLERLIRAQITSIGASAALARTAADDDPAGARAALVDVETSGRATLAQMREVVGELRDVPTEPSPGLDQLGDLLLRATSDVRLTVYADARSLPRSLELSAYRIVEQLLKTLHAQPDARVEVEIRVTNDTLEILVCGPAVGHDGVLAADSDPSDWFDQDRAMNAVRARAQLHGGLVHTRKPLGRREIEVRLPLVPAQSG